MVKQAGGGSGGQSPFKQGSAPHACATRSGGEGGAGRGGVTLYKEVTDRIVRELEAGDSLGAALGRGESAF